MTNALTQQFKILEYLREHGSITSLECTKVLNIVDGRKTISDLRRKGYNITDEIISGTNADGHPIRYKKYKLQEQTDGG